MKTINMKVDGMFCGGCSGRLQRLMEALPQVESCKANHEDKSVVLTLKEDLSREEIEKTLAKGDFTVLSYE
ncbi:MAG: heavy-metal-associated domain-containing protein [Verrucomicrobia bacterium]|nr:heavy-metal-associated domain-containing protein [Lachnospiraceae bacterium]MBR4250347.1 heavy-metal-associated domain-containing protein [Verrucomicrobiota bacterium]